MGRMGVPQGAHMGAQRGFCGRPSDALECTSRSLHPHRPLAMCYISHIGGGEHSPIFLDMGMTECRAWGSGSACE